ncbi:MAG: DUF411 domain-containing protein [Alphaproteobacteria bacterium]
MKSLIAAAAALTLALTLTMVTAAQAGAPLVIVEKSPACGCCAGWVEHMRASGFEVEVRDVTADRLDLTKRMLGVEPEHQSCHTAVVDGYVIEGHVPAADIRRLLAERPSAMGLAVPGMILGSPGMEMGGETEPYDVLLLNNGAGTTVFSSYR